LRVILDGLPTPTGADIGRGPRADRGGEHLWPGAPWRRLVGRLDAGVLLVELLHELLASIDVLGRSPDHVPELHFARSAAVGGCRGRGCRPTGRGARGGGRRGGRSRRR